MLAARARHKAALALIRPDPDGIRRCFMVKVSAVPVRKMVCGGPRSAAHTGSHHNR